MNGLFTTENGADSRSFLPVGFKIKTGSKEETIRNWLQQAAEHATQVEDVLMSKYEIERGQLDALWSYVGHKEQEAEEGKKRRS